jgi:hypothetical protein
MQDKKLIKFYLGFICVVCVVLLSLSIIPVWFKVIVGCFLVTDLFIFLLILFNKPKE